MADRPVIFSAPMIGALLAGRKTVTRRILKPQPDARTTDVSVCRDVWMGCGPSSSGRGTSQWDRWRKLPFVVGDRLYVRERVHIDGADVNYAADQPEGLDLRGLGYRPSIHMPRCASRLTLIVTDVRVERLQRIGEGEAIREGCGQYASSTQLVEAFDPSRKGYYREGFRELWGVLHGPDAWAANPWVVAVSFAVVERNIDDMPLPLAPASELDIAGAA